MKESCGFPWYGVYHWKLGGFKHFWFLPRKLGKWSNLTNVFQVGWNHQPDNICWEVEIWDCWGGRNPAPAGMNKKVQTLWIDGINYAYQMVQDFFHQMILLPRIMAKQWTTVGPSMILKEKPRVWFRAKSNSSHLGSEMFLSIRCVHLIFLHISMCHRFSKEISLVYTKCVPGSLEW